MIVSGGVLGTILGIMTFTFFSEIGKISLIISLLYMYLLAIVGTLMLIDGYREKNRLKKKIAIGIRLNPDINAPTHKKISTGKAEDKFGLSKTNLISFCLNIKKLKRHYIQT